jgi:hypothetical protein
MLTVHYPYNNNSVEVTGGHLKMSRKHSNVTRKHQETPTKNVKEIIAFSLGAHSSRKILSSTPCSINLRGRAALHLSSA